MRRRQPVLGGMSSNSALTALFVFWTLGCLVEPVIAWNDKQQLALALAPKFSGSLSMMGSIFIITDIIKSKEKLGRTYSRILLAMSLYDFFTSLAQGLSTWPIPEGTANVKFASGTTFTCIFQGFFTQLGVGAPMYNCSLSFYYLIVIAFAFTEEKVQSIELWMHLIPLTFSFGSAIAGIPLTLYNSAGLWCWIGALPGGCMNGNNNHGEGECERGKYAWIYRWAIYYVPVWACVLTITFNMTIVSYLVWAKERASQKFRFGHARANNNTASSAGSDAGSHAGSHTPIGDAQDSNVKASKVSRFFAQSKKKKPPKRPGLANQVFWQAFYYVVAFYITWICPTLLRFLQTLSISVPFWLMISMACLLPLQGFFNFLVYVRPRVVQYRRRHPEFGLGTAIGRAVGRTLKRIQVTSSEGYADTEIQDIETLDPCHALQEEKKYKEEERRRSQESLEKIVKGHEQELNYDEEEVVNNGEKAVAPLNIVDKRRMDELKLLEEEDPSFYEGRSSDLNFGLESGEFKDGSKRINRDVDRGSSGQLAVVKEGSDRQLLGKTELRNDIAADNKKPGEVEESESQTKAVGVEDIDMKRMTESEELKQIETVLAGKSLSIEPNDSEYFDCSSYPEFSADPDFFFT